MEDLLDPSKLLRPLYWLLRLCWSLVWEVGVELISWTIGWGSLRLVSLGRYPRCAWSEQDKVPAGQAILIEALGLLVLLGLLLSFEYWFGF